ncbi:twin-arginine translocase subunit TatC [Pseudoclavibacter chungangensis]|uniref:Sec-independent protein translocase protein TatC n=2 Tax=Pseudoclavibacter chungangensis TaxID=587635 RepID=A0A7J5C2D5_9MICO|nr:twin-arginine translocase subunit TatC [Pseudoclavibacter chungangensis]KAB1660201.1 twin-arginine translocase subunit TatC [Pseudoclavibacter chungangensis]
MPVSGHLREAKRRATRIAVALVIGIVLGFVVSGSVLDLLRAPVLELAASRAASLNYDTVTAAFDLRVRIAVVIGIVVAIPVALIEAYRFAAPGLTRRERRASLGVLASAGPLFVLGAATGLALFPRLVTVLTSFAGETDSSLLQADAYVDFVLKTVVVTGIAFVLPVALVVLNAAGVLPARTIARSWRVVVVLIALVAAIVTPAADVLSMFLVALPLAALFGIALGITALADRRRARALERAPLIEPRPEPLSVSAGPTAPLAADGHHITDGSRSCSD